MKNITIIGAGNMGTSLACGLKDAGYEVTVTNRSQAKLTKLASLVSVRICDSNREAMSDADLVILAVKAADLDGVVAEIGPSINYNRTIVASLIPVYSLAEVEERFNPFNKAPMIARVMPNTAVAVGESMTFGCLNEYAAAYASELKTVFEAVGRIEIVDEAKFDAATILCSCGVGYAFRYVRAASQGGVALGFEAQDACRYVCQTLRGAAAVLERSGFHPEAAVDTVTTPGGLTIEGLIAMERAGFSSAVIAGLVEPYARNHSKRD